MTTPRIQHPRTLTTLRRYSCLLGSLGAVVLVGCSSADEPQPSGPSNGGNPNLGPGQGGQGQFDPNNPNQNLGGGAQGGAGNPQPGGGSGGDGNLNTGGVNNNPGGGAGGMNVGGATEIPMVDRDCEVTPGLISDFEEGVPIVIPHEGRTGLWEAFSGGGGDGKMPTVEQTGDTMCNQYALRFSGQGYQDYIGMGISLKGDPKAPEVFDGSQWKGVTFRARSAGNTAAPVRFNISTPASEGLDSGGECNPNGVLTTCYNHVGRFLEGNLALTSEWRTYNFCFDKDLYPLWLPNHLSVEDRNSVAGSLLKMQFQFNKAKNLNGQPLANGSLPEYDPGLEFDIMVDDLAFTNECGEELFQSSAGTAEPFPQNKSGCELPANVERYNQAVSQAYLNWKEQFVRDGGPGLKVISPEQNNECVSEGMGFGMLIAAAMGDKEAFDGFWQYVQSQLEGTGLMRWIPSGSGSATDADQDIAYSLLLAQKQWGGSYSSAAGTMISAIYASDVKGGHITPGSAWPENAYNPSYFAPTHYRAFGSVSGENWSGVLSSGYSILSAADSNFGGANGLVPDWTNSSGNPATASEFNAQVQSTFCQEVGYCDPVFAYDAARVPWRIGMDACQANSNEAKSYLTTLTNYLASQYIDGTRIDLLQAGWKNDGKPVESARENQMSFIGPVAVGAMGSNSSAKGVMMERSLRALLDIMQSPEYNRTYYPTTVGMLTLLMLTGNMPSVN